MKDQLDPNPESRAQKASLAQAANEYQERMQDRSRNMDAFEKRLRHIANKQDDIDARLARIEHHMRRQIRVDQRVEHELMATRATDQALIDEVHRNTNVAKAAQLALTTLSGNVTDLTKKLADAIANSDAADDPAVQAALAELKKNNDDTVAATPVLADAVANVDPNKPPPPVNV